MKAQNLTSSSVPSVKSVVKKIFQEHTALSGWLLPMIGQTTVRELDT